MSLLRYIDCDNAYEDLLSLFMRTLVQDADGNWYVRITNADESVTAVSLGNVECGDTDSLEDIIRNLLYVDTETGELSFAAYNAS